MNTSASKLQVGSCLDVRIHKLDHQGRGLNVDGTIALQGVLPDEVVHVEILHLAQHGPHPARLINVVRPSPERIDPRCAHFLDCGGCDLLHASMKAQHAFKRLVVAEALGQPVLPVVASPREVGYRSIAKLVVGPGRMLGSYRPRSHWVVDMNGCQVHAPEVEEVVDAVRVALKEPPHLDLRYVIVRATIPRGMASVTLISKSARAIGITQLGQDIFELPRVAEVIHHANDSTGDALFSSSPHRLLHRRRELFQSLGLVKQRVRSGAFSQNNPEAATELYAEVVERVGPAKKVLDVYGGSGGIALSLLAAGVEKVTLVERNEQAVAAACDGAEALHVQDKLQAVVSDAEEWLATTKRRFDVVVVNPPRKGCASGLLSTLSERAARLIYVSCNPETLARDLKDSGWKIEGVKPFDLFPQTRHVETVVWATSERWSSQPG